MKIALALAALLLAAHATADTPVTSIRLESAQGGVVTYSYKQDRGGPMGSPYRKQALDLMQAKCGGGSRLLREGEVLGYTSAGMGTIEGTEDEERGRRWGIRFECKGSERGDKPAESLQHK